MYMKKFSEWLRKEINDRNWTQAELAERSSVPNATISRIINNTRDPGPEIANKLAKALNYPPELLFRKAGLLPETKEYAINQGDFTITQELLTYRPDKKENEDDHIDCYAYAPQMMNNFMHLIMNEYKVNTHNEISGSYAICEV